MIACPPFFFNVGHGQTESTPTLTPYQFYRRVIVHLLRPPSGQRVRVEVAAAEAIQGPAAAAVASAVMEACVLGLHCDLAALVGEDRWSLRPRPTDARSRPPGVEERGSVSR